MKNPLGLFFNLKLKRQILQPRTSAERLDYSKKPRIKDKFTEPSQARKHGPKHRNKMRSSKGMYHHCTTLSPIRESTCENEQFLSEMAEFFSLEGIGGGFEFVMNPNGCKLRIQPRKLLKVKNGRRKAWWKSWSQRNQD